MTIDKSKYIIHFPVRWNIIKHDFYLRQKIIFYSINTSFYENRTAYEVNKISSNYTAKTNRPFNTQTTSSDSVVQKL
jgi:hypothetical protein